MTQRELPCTKLTWCVLGLGHNGPCVEVPRKPLPETDFGPQRATKLRYGSDK